ncbi:MAG: class I SAM-dependent methyltransferase [Planctomycetota bacterium]
MTSPAIDHATPPSEDPVEIHDRLLFDRIVAEYRRKDAASSSSAIRRYQVARCVEPVLGTSGRVDTIVEVGCGLGRAARYLKGRYNRYLGIDHSVQMIEEARRLNADCPADFLCANIKSTEIPSKIGDLVILLGALHHMLDVGQVMESLHRIARPGAHFVAFEPNRGNPLIQGLRRIRQRLDPSYSEDQRYFTREELRDLITGHGIKEVQVQYQGYLSTPFAEVVLRPQFVFTPLARLAQGMDLLLDNYLPGPVRFLSWNLIAWGRFA